VRRKSPPIQYAIAVLNSCETVPRRVGASLGSLGERLPLAAQDFAAEGLAALNQLDQSIVAGTSIQSFLNASRCSALGLYK
jgi:hypothetical protein